MPAGVPPAVPRRPRRGPLWTVRQLCWSVVPGGRGRPRLVASIGERIAAIGRLPLLGTVEPVAGDPAGSAASRANSAQRVRALHAAFVVPAELGFELATLSGPVLLVDDLVDSG